MKTEFDMENFHYFRELLLSSICFCARNRLFFSIGYKIYVISHSFRDSRGCVVFRS